MPDSSNTDTHSASTAMSPRSVLFETIHADHVAVVAALNAWQAAAPDAEGSLREELVRRLHAHLDAEEQVLYPELAKVEAITAFIEHMRDQHQEIRAALDAAVAQGPRDHSDASRTLASRIDEHTAEEESRLFDYAALYLAGDLESIAIELADALQKAQGAYGV